MTPTRLPMIALFHFEEIWLWPITNKNESYGNYKYNGAKEAGLYFIKSNESQLI